LSASLPASPGLRAYESDVLRELARKQLGLFRVIAGKDLPREVIGANDVAIPYQGTSDLGDDEMPVLDAIVGQLLGFFRCLQEGLSPDSPSQSGIIHRVVQGFALHLPV
jgi:tagatose-6-phosphate ketose/aldose isomerase